MNERLRFFIENEGLSVRQFENLIGSSDGKIAKFIASNSSLKSDTLSKIMEIFPHLSITWLLTGEGDMLLSSSGNNQGSTKDEPIYHLPCAGGHPTYSGGRGGWL